MLNIRGGHTFFKQASYTSTVSVHNLLSFFSRTGNIRRMYRLNLCGYRNLLLWIHYGYILQFLHVPLQRDSLSLACSAHISLHVFVRAVFHKVARILTVDAFILHEWYQVSSRWANSRLRALQWVCTCLKIEQIR